MTKKPVEVSAYLCGICGRLHQHADQATDCCRCSKCKTAFGTRKLTHQDLCAHCLYGTRLREARKSVRREKERLADAEKWLARLLSDGKPKKGSR